MPFHVYVLYEIFPPAVPTQEQRQQIKTALMSMGRQSDPSPALITHAQANLAKTAVILEVTIDDPVPPLGDIQTDAYQRIAAETGFTEQQVRDNSGFTLFKDDATPNRQVAWQESRLNAVAYLIANSLEWEEPQP